MTHVRQRMHAQKRSGALTHPISIAVNESSSKRSPQLCDYAFYYFIMLTGIGI